MCWRWHLILVGLISKPFIFAQGAVTRRLPTTPSLMRVQHPKRFLMTRWSSVFSSWIASVWCVHWFSCEVANFKKAGRHCLNACKFHNSHFVTVLFVMNWLIAGVRCAHVSLTTVCRFSSISNITRSTGELRKYRKNELYFLVLSMDVTTGRKGQKGPKTGKREAWKYSRKCRMFKRERKGGEKKRNPWRKILKGCFPMFINTTDKTKKDPLAHHGASSGMTPLSVSCICWKSE